MTREEIINVFESVTKDYETYSGLCHMFRSTLHDIVCVDDILFARIPDTDNIIIKNTIVKYSEACEAWEEFESQESKAVPTYLMNYNLLIKEGETYYFYRNCYQSPLSFKYDNGKLNDVCFQCTFTESEKLNDNEYRIYSMFDYFDEFSIHIDVMGEKIVKCYIITDKKDEEKEMEKNLEYDGIEYEVIYDGDEIDHVIDKSTSETLDVEYVGYDDVCDEHHWNVIKDDEPYFRLISIFDEDGDVDQEYTYISNICSD